MGYTWNRGCFVCGLVVAWLWIGCGLVVAWLWLGCGLFHILFHALKAACGGGRLSRPHNYNFSTLNSIELIVDGVYLSTAASRFAAT